MKFKECNELIEWRSNITWSTFSPTLQSNTHCGTCHSKLTCLPQLPPANYAPSVELLSHVKPDDDLDRTLDALYVILCFNYDKFAGKMVFKAITRCIAAAAATAISSVSALNDDDCGNIFCGVRTRTQSALSAAKDSVAVFPLSFLSHWKG